MVVFVPNYDASIARYLVAGADVWLNTPRRPLEASATSGMKASHNATINLSIYDGWWIEAVKMIRDAGWTIGSTEPQYAPVSKALQDQEDRQDASSLYDNLTEMAHMYKQSPSAWQEHMRNSMRLAGHFNTHRVVREYAERAWHVRIG
ncbi:glycogen/starch/alpha-glucan phosphorylase [Candidatus Woesearchaeota archaeon]|nr:glycogen/starch/alpha-glucan phosphorylase [Candidatus Woesearchaeota archaeon]